MLLINSCSNGQQPRDVQLAASVDEQIPTNQLGLFSNTGQCSFEMQQETCFFSRILFNLPNSIILRVDQFNYSLTDFVENEILRIGSWNSRWFCDFQTANETSLP